MYKINNENNRCWELYNKFCNRDSRGAREFVTMFSPGLISHISRTFYFSNEENKELLQEAWIKLFNSCKRELSKGSCTGYLFATTRSACIDCIKKKNTKKRISEKDFVNWENVIDLLEDSQNIQMTSENPILTYTNLLKKLPQKQSQAMYLYLKGYTIKEIAILTEAKVEAVRTQIRTAKEKLKKVLHPQTGTIAMKQSRGQNV